MDLAFFIRLKDMMSGGLVKMASTAQKANAQIKGSNGMLSQSYYEIKRKIQDLEKTIGSSKTVSQIREARKELGMLQKMQSKHIGNTDKGGGSWLGGMMRQALPVMGIAGALALGGSTFNSAMAQTSQKSAINFATNGQGDKAVSSVKGINDKYGLNNEAGLEGFKTLAGSVRSLNMPLEETLRIYESVGAAGAAMKVDAEAQKGIYLALGQIASKGTVSAEELRGQIGERLPGAFGIAAKAMGVTEQELGKMMQKGELLSKDFLPKFATELQNTFGKQALDEANSPSAIVNRFDNTLLAASVTIGSMLMPAITTLMQGFIDLSHWVQDNWEWIGLLVTVFGSFALMLGGYSLAMGIASAWTTLMAGEFVLLNTIMAMNPIFLVAAAIAALVLGVIYAWNTFEGFRMALYGLWGSFKQIFTNIGNFFAQIFSPITTALDAFNNPNLSAWEKTKAIGSAIGELGYNLTPMGMIENAAKFTAEGGLTKGVSGAFDKESIRGRTMPTAEESALANKRGTEGANAIADMIANKNKKKSGLGGIYDSLTTSKTKDSETDSIAKGVTSGGPRVININGVKFADKIEIHSNTLTEGIDEIEKKCEDWFMRVLYSGAKLQG